jgi:hypothetical protein
MSGVGNLPGCAGLLPLLRDRAAPLDASVVGHTISKDADWSRSKMCVVCGQPWVNTLKGVWMADMLLAVRTIGRGAVR